MLSTKEELEALLRSLDVWVIIFGVVVSIGVTGESVVGFIHFRKSSQLQRLQTAENLAQQAEIERLRSDTAMSVERAAHAEQQAAESNKIAEGEQRARVQLQRLVTWRTLTPAQQTELGAQLKKYVGIRFAVSVNAGDPEGFSFAYQIAMALRDGAKWDLVAFAPVMNLGGFKTGVTIVTSGDANTMSASDALTHELLARGFNAVRLCLPEISKYLTGQELYFLHNSSRCSFFSRHSLHLWPRSSGRVLPWGSRTWLYAIKSACSRGQQESAQN